jgi:hypothetical protein
LIHIRPASDLKCRPRASARANLRPQPHSPPAFSSPLHTNFFSPECRPSCRLRSCWRANALPHTVQTNGRSSVCVRRWDRRLYALVKRFGQSVHWKVAGCFWTRFGPPGPLSCAPEPVYSGSARRSAITLFGTDDVDCLRCRFGEGDRPPAPDPPRSSGDREREASDRPDTLGDKLDDADGVR